MSSAAENLEILCKMIPTSLLTCMANVLESTSHKLGSAAMGE